MHPGTLIQAGPCWPLELYSSFLRNLSAADSNDVPVWFRNYCGEGSQGAVGLEDVQEAGDNTSLHFTSMWWAPQQGGHSNICLRWGLACELERFTAGEQDRSWDSSCRRYRKSLSYEHEDITSSPHFSSLTENLAERLVASQIQLSVVQLFIHINILAHL